MPKLRLTYFDFDGGRGEPARIALSIGGVAFEDHRVAMAQWRDLKPSMPYGAMPVLEVDGQALPQSNSINRYVGKLSGLYPEDALQAAFCDEIMDAVEDASAPLAATFGMDDKEAMKAKREALTENSLRPWVRNIGRRLEARGGEFFADNRFTIADIRVALWVRYLRSGTMDYVPTDVPDTEAPALVAHCERTMGHPGIKAYYAGRKS